MTTFTTTPDVDLRDTERRLAADVFDIRWSPDEPASLIVRDSSFVGRTEVALVEVFTAAEQRSRTSQAYFRSAVGGRLRVQGVERGETAADNRIVVTQKDGRTGLETRTVITQPRGVGAVRVQTELRNAGSSPVTITAVSSLSIGFGRSESDLDGILLATADSEWLAENRWREVELRQVLPMLSLAIHGQDGRGHFGLDSHGAWSSGEHIPCGVLTSTRDGIALAWQIETSAGWHVDLAQTAAGGILSLLGPADLEHQFARELAPGDSFLAVPVAVSVSGNGRDGAIAELNAYRRRLRADRDDQGFPVVYNDFMNTLMGQPSSEALLPLIAAAAASGVEVFCIDAGWFAEPSIGDWWSSVGAWKEAETRFANGLKELTDEILAQGMRVGLWLEPEVVGVGSAAATSLPDDAFFQRFGQRVVEHDRYHLDFRHPAARAHMDEVVDRLVREYGTSYLKLDYNINPGAGTEWLSTTAGDGLLAHSRAFRDWLIEIQQRHPGLLVENCSSGAMRADYSLLEVAHLQSTSDQQDFRLYPPIAASAPVSILPEQCGNWAYPAADMDDEETIFTLVTGLSGRLYLSGFLDRLRPSQRDLVAEAVSVAKQLREDIAEAVPFWPLGLPAWDAEAVCLGLHTPHGDLVFVWDRRADAASIAIPGITGEVEQLFPRDRAGWRVSTGTTGLDVRTAPGFAARVFRITSSRGETR